jgi:hypothetical protein
VEAHLFVNVIDHGLASKQRAQPGQKNIDSFHVAFIEREKPQLPDAASL